MPLGGHNHSENVTPEQSFTGPELSHGGEAEAGAGAGDNVPEGSPPPKTNMVSLQDFDLIKVKMLANLCTYAAVQRS